MKNLLVHAAGIASAVFAISAPANAALIDFEDLSLAPNSYNQTAPFSSGGATISNYYDSKFNYWEGFAYSNMGDTSTSGFLNMYSSFTGSGAGDSDIFAVGYIGYRGTVPAITLPEGNDVPLSIEITNTTYAALSLRDGDNIAKKFGGPTGNDPDYFRLTISGLDAAGALLGTVDFYLADFRSADNSQDYIVDTWTTVDISSLGSGVRQLTFALESSDNGEFGMNTPASFAVDNVQVVPEPGSCLLVGLGLAGFAFTRPRRR